MQRQVRIFLDDADEEELIRAIDHGDGVRRLRGRFFKGSAEDVLNRPEELETAELRSGERWTHLIHPKASKEMVVHPVTDGPFVGWSKLDDVRSEVLTLVRPLKDSQGLAPAQLRGSTHAWFGGERLRKSPEFAQWAAESMRAMENYPATAFDWIRIAPAAAEWARAGGRVHYLFRAVPLQADASATAMYRPHASTKD